MPPIIGNIIVICALAVVIFLCGRSAFKSIRAELRGEGTCAGCNGCSTSGSKKDKGSAACMSCIKSASELESLLKK